MLLVQLIKLFQKRRAELFSYFITPDLSAEIICSLKRCKCTNRRENEIRFKKINIEENASLVESAGADYIIVHGRTRNQFYSGKTDKSIFKKIKKIVKIPVGASGDVFTLKDYEEYINDYCADFCFSCKRGNR